MNETASLFFALLGGLALGTFFFGGLRWTVHKGMMSNKPGLWFFWKSVVSSHSDCRGNLLCGRRKLEKSADVCAWFCHHAHDFYLERTQGK